MSILMEDTDNHVITGVYMRRQLTPNEEEAMKLIEASKLKAKRVSAPKQPIGIDAGRMF